MNDDDKFILGVLLILLLTSIYTYNLEPINRDKLIVVEGTLKELPFFSSNGGDFSYPYMKLKLNKHKEYFVFKNCSYKLLDLVKAKKMIIGDSLRVEAVLRYNEYRVYDLSYPNGYVLLDFEKLNDCERNRWKEPFYLGGIALLILMIRIIVIPIWRKFNHKNGDSA